MHTQRWIPSIVVALLAALGAVGCEAPGVGDPCTPESVPPCVRDAEGVLRCGFNDREAYLETSSVQCRTRVCMVYKLSGDPNRILGESPECLTDSTGCVTQDAVDDRVYCTCRCRAPAGVDTTVCECPEGFACEEVLELGGDGIRGSYCVRSSTVAPG
jgi:hypothetical protein